MTRQQANKEILLILSKYLETFPDLRFSQALCNLGIASHLETYNNPDRAQEYRDIFFTESTETLQSLQRWLIPRKETSDPDSLPGEND